MSLIRMIPVAIGAILTILFVALGLFVADSFSQDKPSTFLSIGILLLSIGIYALLEIRWTHRHVTKLEKRLQSICETPINCVLFCPECGQQHIDAPDPASDWTNPPHRTHECQGCGYRWRPSEAATNGIAVPAYASISAPIGLWTPTHRHYKGGLYRVLNHGRIERNLEPCVIYQNQSGQIWVRPKSEFYDGRFTALNTQISLLPTVKEG